MIGTGTCPLTLLGLWQTVDGYKPTHASSDLKE
jgi:hypothetical protein